MFGKKDEKQFKYPGTRMAMDGNTAVVMCEREASDAAGAYPITPSTQMGEYWAEEVASGHLNVSGNPLIFVEPESEHAAAAVTAGMSMTGLRATNFSSAQGVAFMHESLYAAVGKRLPYVLNIGSRAITKASLNVHCAHDDYHCIDDTGFFQVFGKSAQEAADLNLIARKIAELTLTPAAVGQDGFLTTHLIEPLMVPERALIEAFLGRPDDVIECPTPAQRLVYGPTRRRVPLVWDVDSPFTSGTVQNQDAYMQAVAGQRPYFFDHIEQIADQVMDEFYELTGRRYHRATPYRCEDADYLLIGQGSMVTQAEAVADYLRESRGLKVGVVNMTMFRPFPGDAIARLLQGKKGVAILERTDQPLAEDLPIMRETRAALTKCLENGMISKNEEMPYPLYPTYKSGDMPRLYSGCYGLGSRDLQPEGLIAAVENMLPEAKRRKFFYLSVDFMRAAADPKDEIRIQALKDAYPNIGDMALRGSENPNLLPKGAVTVRMHSVGGWGAVTTGKNLAMTLYDLLGYDIRANPKYGSEKKGQPTTYFLSAAPEPIRLNCEYTYVDVVLSPDPNVFTHSDPLSGLDRGGSFVIQSSLDNPEQVWASFPPAARKFIVEREIRVFYIDGFKIAREEASNPELQFRMQGNAFQGAFFAASPLMERSGLDEKGLFASIEEQLRSKFGGKGERVVQDNLRIVRRGFDEIFEITDKPLVSGQFLARKEPGLPIMLKTLPEGDGGVSDVHRFWEQTGSFYASGRGSDNLTDPHMALSLMPASTGVYRDMTQIRFAYPKFVPENCTACGSCFSVCPDSALPGLVNKISDVFATAIARVERGMPTQYLRRETRTVEKRLRALIEAAGETADMRALMDQAVLETLAAFSGEPEQKEAAEKEFGLMMQALADYQFAITKPYWTNREKKQKGSGGLFSITVNPYTCKGCMECIEVCNDGALIDEPQTEDRIKEMQARWGMWLDLPTTDPDFIRIDDLDDKVGALETLLLDKKNYQSMVSGDGSCMGCGEKTALHLFTSTVTALMQPRVKRHLAEIDDLINRLETHIRLKLASSMDLSDTSAIGKALDSHKDNDLMLSDLSAELEDRRAQPVDPDWLKWVTALLGKLRHLKSQYTAAQPRAEMGIVNSTGCSSVWGATFPYNPYPFPWSNNLFQDAPSMALGLFEGHMRKMGEGFKAIRQARQELDGTFNAANPASNLTYFGWKDFSDEEWKLCPPVVAIGGDGAMYDIGFQNLSRALMSGHPVKILVLDTQAYSNTGGQSCTSGFIGQVADMAPYGKQWKGKTEVRKEMGLIGMAHRTSFVLNSSASHLTHLLEGYIDGLNSRRPALFNVYTSCQPEHGIGDDMSNKHARMAVESRAYPLFRFDPDAGTSFEECCSIEGNPNVDQDWISWSLKYINEKGEPAEMEVPFTFVDFAMSEGRFRKHFRKAPPETWNDSMVRMDEFLNLDDSDRDGLYPYIWAVDAKNRLMRVLVSQELVLSCEERRHFWTQIRGICGELNKVDVEAVRNQAKAEMAQKLTSSLLAMAVGEGNGLAGLVGAAPVNGGGHNGNGAAHAGANGSGNNGAGADADPVWVETPECTACDECITINPKIFKYNTDKKVEILDPKGGPFKDIVKAAEKCGANCIHPGMPWNPAETGLDKLIKRAEKFQ
ncbi:pyruvate flavodoxin/ferredoxin oxidoreductase domain protein [Thiorhodococcus drewsii AZ1]|uniref:Pyruvate flavodoxin/ferredoxin oxidoreductase domain protein n=1 Tax=Thiorhodococcus drewsii AZ1 TaxID=765913 RepID=G2E0Z9_9GAMM|nr:2-oxoacid:acceptor oxidoreductase family protein [Thiorhodococcus drewsii]EGV31340.1 pyruvate flavodoxin/ferredoxin oxidoreductase domain protein [Thiorhodococcus drewsii AZ1]